MFVVNRATELDGVTIKDADPADLIAETGVTKRKDMLVINANTLHEVERARCLVIQDEESGQVVTTSQITKVKADYVAIGLESVLEVAVHTKYTIYFLRDARL